MTPSKKSSALQLEHIVATSSGYAFEHGLELREPYQVVNTHGISSITCHSILEGGETSSSQQLRPELTFTRQEINAAGKTGKEKAVVVGLFVDTPAEVRYNFTPNKASSVGNRKPSTAEKISTECCLVQWVVVKLKPSKKPVTFRVLLNQEDGLAIGYICPQEKVFLFAEFRTAHGSKSTRNVETNKLVKEFILANDPIDSQEHASHAEEEEPTTDLESADPELPAIFQQFINIEIEFGFGDTEEFISEFKELCYDFEDLTPDAIFMLRRQLVQESIELDPRLL